MRSVPRTPTNRDRATETLDQLDAIREAEGSWHERVRRRRGLPAPQVTLAPAELQILARWRADVDLGGDGMTGPVNDLSRAEGETRLRELETHAPRAITPPGAEAPP